MSSASPPSRDAVPTVFKNINVKLHKNLTSIAVDPTGRTAVFSGRSLVFVDLEDPNKPSRLAKDPKNAGKDISLVAWSAEPSIIGSSSLQTLSVWNYSNERQSIVSQFQCHRRAISYFDWNRFDPNIVATCSMDSDSYLYMWDIRNAKSPTKAKAFRAHAGGATQCKFNRVNDFMMASTHGTQVLVWDIRQEASPLTVITADTTSIVDLDWNFKDANQLVSCSQNHKFWDVEKSRQPLGTLPASIAPFARVKYTPFGHGLVTLTTIANHVCDIYSVKNPASPDLVRELMQESAPCSRMQWRVVPTPQGQEYQLLTWSPVDEYLRMWTVEASDMKKCGEEPSEACNLHSVERLQRILAAEQDAQASKDANGASSAQATPDGAAPPVSPRKSTSGSPVTTQAEEMGSPNSMRHKPRAPSITSAPVAVPVAAPRQMTLDQEWALLKRNPPAGITVERTNKADRSLLVTAQHGPHMVQVRVTFPSMYPNAAPPSFQLLSNISPHSVVKTKEAMVDTAQEYIDNNMNCLEPCFRKLMEVLKQEASTMQTGVGGGTGAIPGLTIDPNQFMSPIQRMQPGPRHPDKSPLGLHHSSHGQPHPNGADIPAGHTTYIVKPADSLAAIALMFKMTVGELRKLNNIHHSAQLMPGHLLIVKQPQQGTPSQQTTPVTPKRRSSISQQPLSPYLHHAQSIPLQMDRLADGQHSLIDPSAMSPASPSTPTLAPRARNIAIGSLQAERALVKKMSFSRDDIKVGASSVSPDPAPAIIGSVGSAGSVGSPSGPASILGTPPSNRINPFSAARRAGRNTPRGGKGFTDSTLGVVQHLRVKYVDMTEEPPIFINGVLTLTEAQLIFEPELDDPAVQRRGLRHYTVSAEMSGVLHAEALKPTDLSFGTDMREMFLQILSREKHHGTGSNIMLFVSNNIPKVQEWSKVISEWISQSKEKNLMASLNLDSYMTKLPSLRSAANLGAGTPREKRAGSGSASANVGSAGSAGGSSGLFGFVGKAAVQFGKGVFNAASATVATVSESIKALSPPENAPSPIASFALPDQQKKPKLDLDDEDMPHLLQPSAIITDEHVAMLAPYLPLRQRFCDWKLLFSTAQNGTSLITFFAKVKGEYPTLIIIKDSDGYVFGGFASEQWEPRRGYFGTGECFLFSLEPSVAVYTWTKADSYFMFARRDCIAMGGQGTSGRNGFWLDSEFNYGTSEVCKTFLNRRLSAAEEFKCTVVEVYAFVT